MTTQIEIKLEGRDTPFTLEWQGRSWHCPDEPKESDFPLVAIVDGKRYELYSDQTFAEVDR